jgi:hypothetical protein
LLVMTFGLAVAAAAGAPIAYMLWPQSKSVTPDAPSIPVIVGGVAFNMWPSLQPPDAAVKPLPTDIPDVTDRLFVTIAAGDSTLPPLERFKVIYPRYTDSPSIVGPDGLSRQSFRDGSVYQGEDLMHDPSSPEQFLLRCTRPTGSTPPMCLHERRIAGADITLRFPRQWLDDWRNTAAGIERLIANFKPTPQ